MAEDLGNSGATAPNPAAGDAATAPGATTAPGGEAAPNGDEKSGGEARTFTQEELNRIVAREKAAAARKGERIGSERYRAQAAEAEVARLRQQLEGSRPSDTPKGKPSAKDFEAQGKTPEDYLDALADWKISEKLSKEREERERETVAGRDERAAHEGYQKLAPGLKKYADFDEVVFNPDAKVSGAMREAIKQCEAADEVAYHLLKDEAEVERIFALPPALQIREVFKFEDKLKAAPKPSAAPTPIKPAGGTGSASHIDPDKMPIDQWHKWRTEQVNRKR